MNTQVESYYLCFPDKTTAEEQLRKVGLVSEEGEILTSGPWHAIDILGEIERPGERDEEGNEIPPPTKFKGWHINFLGELPSELEPFSVRPKHPVRVWFLG